MAKQIVHSLIAGSQEELDRRIEKVRHAADWFQLDIMDGVFVKNRSLDFDFTLPEGRFEAHLMVEDPASWISAKADEVDVVIMHIESCDDPEEIIAVVKGKGKRVGLALNPETPVDRVRPYLEKIDQVLVMTVHPGKYGEKFIPSTLDKVRELRTLAPRIDIEVDGGIDNHTIRLAAEAGANRFVSGSFIIRSDDPKKAVAELEEEAGFDG